MSDFDSYTIEPFEDKFAVYGHGTYEESSVLAGQYRRCFIDMYDTEEEAQKAHPEAESSGSTKFMSDQMMDSFENSPAPDWFDPADAGEEW